jgi:tRNA A37 threonylcarbamoyladenosine dehydratase
VQEVRTNSKNPPIIRLFDADNLEETNTNKQIEAKWNRIMKQCPEELPVVA